MTQAGSQPPEPGHGAEHLPMGDGGLDVRLEQLGPRLVALQVTGEVDMLTAPLLAARVRDHFSAAGGALVVDMTGVSFLGSAGLAVLAEAANLAAGQSSPLRVVADSAAVLRPLQVTGLDDVLVTCDSLATAIGEVTE